jgi:hypothetical protein
VAIGNNAMTLQSSGDANVAIGYNSLNTNTGGNSNVAIGYATNSGNFSGSVILGRQATATASNQFVVGSGAYPAGTITAEVNASSQVWNVIINGVARKILLA